MTKLDVVIPVFNEVEIIDQLHSRVVAACQATGLQYEIIYVDDGSHDETANWILDKEVSSPRATNKNPELRLYNHNVSLLRLSRNFGQPSAILAGLKKSTGDCVVILDGDLQDPPELIPEMVRLWQAGDEVVIAQRKTRKETFLRGLAFRTFHWCFRYLSDSNIPANTGTFCLLDQRAASEISALQESHRFFPGLRTWVGFKQTNLQFDRQERAGGQPKQTFVRLIRYALDAIFGFSLKPLRVLTAVGSAICIISFSLAVWFLFKRVIGWETASIGFTTLTCAVFGLGGFQLIGMGILGEYIGRIYDEVKGRPQFVVAEEHHFSGLGPSEEINSPLDSMRKAG